MQSANGHSRIDVLDWFKGCAIIAVVLDHLKIVPGYQVFWSVNLFVLVTAFLYSQARPFSLEKLAFKIFQILYLTAAAVFVIKGLSALVGIPSRQGAASIFFSVYSFFIANKCLGDIWYIALHLQFLVLFYVCLKMNFFSRPKLLFAAALPVNLLSYTLTHIILWRFHTILVTSWLVFLFAGFYGMYPLLKTMRDYPHSRLMWAAASLAFMLALYFLEPVIPWFFENGSRAFFIGLPFYAALVVFLTESFYLLEKLSAGRFLKAAVELLGRHSLAIYLTHEAFMRIWVLAFHSKLVIMALCILAGIAFGTLADELFGRIKVFIEKHRLFAVFTPLSKA